ncbi:MAG: polyphosphate kinase 1 [Actinobacteria bacterium]|nr:polyphosphate kinase 1 [Actinomycetota bacterium]
MTFWRNRFSVAHRTPTDSYAVGIGRRYINRELSWLDFNDRVLTLSRNKKVPLLERCRFLAICSSNLDEFYQIRVAALKDQVAGGITTATPDGLTPLEQLRQIILRTQGFVDIQHEIWSKELLPELAEAGIRITAWSDLDDAEKTKLSTDFDQRMFPVLTPLVVDPAHPFPYISNLALNLAVVARDPNSGEQRFARLKVPKNLTRFVRVGDGQKYVLLEDVISANMGRLFKGMTIEQCFVFRVTRNADLSLDDEDAEDLLAAVEMELRRRRFGRAVRIEIPRGTSQEALDLMCEELELEADDVTFHRGMIEMNALNQLASLDIPDLRYRPWPPLTAGRLVAAELNGQSIFQVIRERQLLVHHPHESFSSSVEAFVEQATNDPKVHSIKITLYRTSGDSSIAKQLVRAAEAGKQVAVVLEIKARFDEARNIAWAKELEYAGVHVTYGIVGLKTHSKCILVVREDNDQMRRYVHIGTGNYNSVTARLYEDIGFFTCEEQIGADATELFNYLTGYAKEPDYLRLFVAPHQLRPRILELIHREASYGSDGRIALKLNSISDPAVIDALYMASNAGVKIDLVVRGICCLRAGVAGMSENIRVRSILGRYLEHSRIYRFEHGLEDGSPLHLIGSADLMGRNLDGRVEVLVPLTHPKHRAWLDKVLGFLLDEGVEHFALGDDDLWRKNGVGDEVGDAQQRLHEWVVATQVR